MMLAGGGAIWNERVKEEYVANTLSRSHCALLPRSVPKARRLKAEDVDSCTGKYRIKRICMKFSCNAR